MINRCKKRNKEKAVYEEQIEIFPISAISVIDLIAMLCCKTAICVYRYIDLALYYIARYFC